MLYKQHFLSFFSCFFLFCLFCFTRRLNSVRINRTDAKRRVLLLSAAKYACKVRVFCCR
jgi:hypothetical protein